MSVFKSTFRRKVSVNGVEDCAGRSAESAAPVGALRPHPPTPTGFRYVHTRALPVSLPELRKRRVVVGSDKDAATVAFKTLRTQLLQKMRTRGMSTLAITSVHGGAGKSVTAVNLAIAMGLDATHTVLLVDLDLRKPGIAELFGWRIERGVLDHVLDEVPLAELLVHPGLGRLVILPGQGSIENSSELLAGPSVQQLVTELKGRYPGRVVLFDLPAVGESDDMLAFAPYVDGIVLVVEEGMTRRGDLEQALSMLPREKLLGTVLNKSGR